MHESTRRFLCRCGFLLLCLLPTVIIGTWVLACRTDMAQTLKVRELARRIEQVTGLAVHLDRLSYEPAQTILHGLELRDPETDALIARARLVGLYEADDQLHVQIAGGEFQLEQLRRVWEAVDFRLLRHRGSARATRVTALQITLHSGDQSQTFTDLDCRLLPQDEQRKLALEFRLAGEPTNEPTRLVITRDRRQPIPVTHWNLTTGSSELPCSLLAPHHRLLEQLGPRCLFQGTVSGTQAPSGWSGKIAGHFRQVDLDRVLYDGFGQKLSGTAHIAFREAEFHDGRLIRALGTLRAEDGVVAYTLLERASRYLPVVLNPQLANRVEQTLPGDWLQYDWIDLAFQIQGEELRLAEGTEGSTVLKSLQGPLLLPDADRAVPAVHLAQTLVPESHLQISATRETYGLLQALPLPSATPISTTPALRFGRKPQDPPAAQR